MNINCYELNGYWYASARVGKINGLASKKSTAKDAIIKAVGDLLNKYWTEKTNH